MSDSKQPPPLGAQSRASRHVVDALAESFVARLRGGQRPTIDEYVERHPELAQDIRRVFSTLLLLEQGADAFADSADRRSSASGPPEQLGEYRILREIGRGGMGIVYEAEHNTMGRRVALKVLPAGAAPDDVRLKRFRLEARLAGRLHHSNIVPVFEVGTDRGCHFYAMQFIRGQNLDIILDELRRLRGEPPGQPPARVQRSAEDAIAGDPRQVGETVAWNLRWGGPDQTVGVMRSPGGESPAAGAALAPETDGTTTAFTQRRRSRLGANADQPGEATPDGQSRRESPAASTPSEFVAPTPGGTSVSAGGPVRNAVLSDSYDDLTGPLTATRRGGSAALHENYFARVARVGLQIAEALAYAHAHGVLHRDIKPSNIILDDTGVAWVTDFGLAKREADELTRSGDLVGTMKYMAPERFDGKTDARSDLYGLGLTLYELCTLESAFPAGERSQLLRNLYEAQPASPRSVSRDVPRDLETIILKSIEKQPSRRYASANDLAEDLRLFLSDRPIRARRVSAAERTWRWCRRNPQQAVLAGCVLLLLTVVTLGSLAFGYINRQNSRALARSELRATERLYESLRRSAEASYWSRRPGQSFASLGDTQQAAEILRQLGWPESRVDREVVDLRSDAIAAIALPDVRLHRSWPVESPWTRQVTFDPTHRRFAQATEAGTILIRTVRGNREVVRLPAPEKPWAAVGRMAYDPDGERLAVLYTGPGTTRFVVWTLATRERFVVETSGLGPSSSFGFLASGDSVLLAAGRRLIAYRLTDGQRLNEIELPAAARRLAVSSSKPLAAVVLGKHHPLQVWDISTGDLRGQMRVSGEVFALAWHPHQQQLAIGMASGVVELHNVETWPRRDAPAEPETTEPDAVLPPTDDTLVDSSSTAVREFWGHGGLVNRICFSPTGHHLMSQAWDGTLRLWDASSGNQLMRMEAAALLPSGFSQRDARWLGTVAGSEIRLWEVRLDTPLKILHVEETGQRRWSVDMDPTGRWLVSAQDTGVELWDLERSQRVDFLPSTRTNPGASKDACFVGDGHEVLVSDGDGLRLVPLSRDERGDLTFHRQRARQLRSSPSSWISMSADGMRLGIREDTRRSSWGLISGLRDQQRLVKVGPHVGIDHVELSPGGRLAATTSWGGRGVLAWDAVTGDRLTGRALEAEAPKTNAKFSPDGTRLTVATPDFLVTYRVADWRPVYRIRRTAADDWPGPLAYSPDGRLLVAAHSRFMLGLYEAGTGRLLGLLNVPSNVGFHDCCLNADGRLLAAATDTHIHLWNLRHLRHRLAQIGLDWQ